MMKSWHDIVKICGGEIEQGNPADICVSCHEVMNNMNMGTQSF